MNRRKHLWSVAGLVTMTVLAFGSAEDSGSPPGRAGSPTKRTTPSSPTPPRWTTSTSRDEMTGERSCYAASPRTGPQKAMGFPYGDVQAWLGVGHDSDDEWAYVGFSESPNLTDTETKDGYNVITTRIKWDDEIETVSLIQEWGAKSLHFRYGTAAIAKMARSNTVLLELNWYGQGKTYFQFSLNGSSAAIREVRSCGG